MSCTFPLLLSSIGADADVVFLAIHGLISTFCKVTHVQ